MIVLMILAMLLANTDTAIQNEPKVKLIAETDINGLYYCQGKDYQGSVLISKKNEIYIVVWSVLIENGTTNNIGVGIRTGDNLSVGWTIESNDKSKIQRGVTIYRINGKQLNGRWTSIPGNGRIQTESLTWMHELE